jgi:hypothetical protein
MRRRILPFLATLFVACGDASAPAGERSQSMESAADAAVPSSATAPPAPADLQRYAADKAGIAGGATDGDAPQAAQLPLPDHSTASSDAAPAMIIRNGWASVEVDSLETAASAVRAMVQRVGGYVGNATLAAGRDQVRSATFELRVPSARFDEVVGGLAPLGRVESVNVTAQDVGEEYVDLSARAENARRLEARIIELLANRTGKLGDVLAVERELSRVREEIERYDGRMRFLRARASTSALTLTLHEAGPIVGLPGDGPIAEAFRQAWRNLVGMLAWLIAASGVLVPLALLAALGIFLVRRRRRPEPAVS